MNRSKWMLEVEFDYPATVQDIECAMDELNEKDCMCAQPSRWTIGGLIVKTNKRVWAVSTLMKYPIGQIRVFHNYDPRDRDVPDEIKTVVETIGEPRICRRMKLRLQQEADE